MKFSSLGSLVVAGSLLAWGCAGSVGSKSERDDDEGDDIDDEEDDIVDGDDTVDDGPGGAGGSVTIPSSCKTVGPSPIRRLSRAEYWNTLRDLFAGTDVGRPTVTPDPLVRGFENRAEKLYATENNVNEFSKAAMDVAAKVVANLGKVVPCTTQDAACGASFVDQFGMRAFRRPLTTDEKTRYTAFFEKQRTALGFKEAVQLTIEGMLQSSSFLYRMDLGEGGAEKDGRVRLGDYDIASRLSYLLWGSMPDATLFEAAKAGKLSSDADIVAQAKRMLGDGRARAQLVDFHRQWLDFEHVIDVFQREGQKDTTRYPEYTAELRAAMREENDRFTDLVMSGSRSLKELLTSRETLVNEPLAAFYGVAKPASGWSQARLPEAERGGFLTRGAFLASHAHKFSGSPPLRAVYVMRRLMCMPELVPDPTADTSEPVSKPGEAPKTNRQLFEARVAAKASCAGCHQLIDPIGFTFENYDAIGKFRTKDNGFDVDATGELKATDVDGPVKNAIELSDRLGESRIVHACMASHWLAFATGVDPEAEGEDDCRTKALTDVLLAADGDVHALLLALVKSPDFLTRPASP